MKSIICDDKTVNLILQGHKTSIRRALNPAPPEGYILAGRITDSTYSNDTGKVAFTDLDYRDSHLYKMPYEVGDVLFVKETWKGYEKVVGNGESHRLEKFLAYKADEKNDSVQKSSEWFDGLWKSALGMSNESARIFLKVTNVRIEKLQDITLDGFKTEGITHKYTDTEFEVKNLYPMLFAERWDSKLKGSNAECFDWISNPWVFVFEFEKCERPLDVRERL